MFSKLRGATEQNNTKSTQSLLEDFQYQTLRDAANIRLIHINPGTDSQDIKCSIVEVDWSTVPQYEALSYTWGTPGTNRSILCDGRRADVSVNLFEALQQLRRPDREVVFWIDQLSINQDDLEERGSQVALMGNIYSKASRVIVWLGPEDADSKVGITLAYKVLEVVGARSHFHLMPEHMKSLSLPPYKDKRWRALGQFLQRPWFTRMWVIQEVVMASNAIFLCGNEVFTMEQMKILVDRLLHLTTYKSFNGNLTTGTNGIWCLGVIEKLREMRGKATLMSSIEILGIGMASRATDPRDKLYAVLGLGEFRIEADYSKTVEEVYTNYAITYLSQISKPGPPRRSSKYLTDPVYSKFVGRLLVWVHSTESTLNLPSWVPDWSRFPVTSFIGATSLRDPSGVKIPPDPGNEEKYRSTEISLLPNHTLRLSGKLYDTISRIGSQHIDLRRDVKPHVLYAAFADWYAETGQLVSHAAAHSVYPKAGIPWQEAYTRTLAMDNIGIGRNRGDGRGGSSPDAVHLQWSHGALRQWNRSSSLTKFLTGGADNEATFWHDALKVCGRCFFLTEKGYMGLAPVGAAVGDRVVTLLGIEMPFVLREVKAGFRLVGTCYVQGIMSGEVVLMDEVPFEAVTLV